MYFKHIALFSVVALLAVAVRAQDADYDYEYDADMYSDDSPYLVRRANPAGVYPNAGDPNYTPKKTHPAPEDPGRFKGKSPAGVYANAGPSGAGARPHPLATGHGGGKHVNYLPSHYQDPNNEPGVRTRLHHPLAPGVPRGPKGTHERGNAHHGQPIKPADPHEGKPPKPQQPADGNPQIGHSSSNSKATPGAAGAPGAVTSQ